MFDIGWSELLVIGVVALIVVGPKDLPGMFHALGRFTAKARSMAREFSRAMEDTAKESGVGDVAKDLKGMTSAKGLGLDKVQQAVGKFEAWDPLKKPPPAAKSPETKTETKPAGPATQALSEERAEAKRKIEEASAKRALERQAKAEAEAQAPAAAEPKAPAPAAAPEPAAKPKPKAKPAASAATPAAEKAAKPKRAAKPKPDAKDDAAPAKKPRKTSKS